jgi:isopenicillin-N epimerase
MSPSVAADHWQLHPEVDFLNHGSFGATPTCVLEVQRQLQDDLEREPIRFLGPERELGPKLDSVRAVLANMFQADPTDLVFVRSATEGVNAVVRSFPFQLGDEVVVTNHGYNACNNAADFAAHRSGATVRTAMLPFPVHEPQEILDAIEQQFNNRTRLLLIDHVTSPTGLVLPLKSIIDLAHSRGIRVLVDGAHAPGMVPIDLRELNPDYYTGNHHKWLCAPKASGFLYVRRELQPEVRPAIISHGANRPSPNRSRFLSEFDWTGTFDPTPLLSVPAAVEFLAKLGGGDPPDLQPHMSANRELTLRARQCLLDALQVGPPAPEAMIGSMVTIPLPPADDSSTRSMDPLQVRLFDHYRIEVPIFFREPRLDARCLRISVQAYNDLDQYRRLGEALATELART